MAIEKLILISFALAIIAFLYSSVGHAGASGYIAVLTLFGLHPAVIKPIALSLNILVAIIGSFHFYRAGYFSWRLFWPFALLAVPMAFLGGFINLPLQLFKILVGVVLIFSGLRIYFPAHRQRELRSPTPVVAVPVGGALGLIAGLTGTGGGIFLTPLLLLCRWASIKNAAAVSAVFILFNSLAGLFGNLSKTRDLPPITGAFVIAVLIGGTLGSFFGSRKFHSVTIERILSLVLLIAGAKLVLTP